MKVFIGFIMVILGAVVGLYVGGYLMLYGGIVDVISGFTGEVISAGLIAWGVLKVFFAAAVGWLSAAVLMVPGVAIISTRW